MTEIKESLQRRPTFGKAGVSKTDEAGKDRLWIEAVAVCYRDRDVSITVVVE